MKFNDLFFVSLALHLPESVLLNEVVLLDFVGLRFRPLMKFFSKLIPLTLKAAETVVELTDFLVQG